jgi:hypothetical protein
LSAEIFVTRGPRLDEPLFERGAALVIEPEPLGHVLDIDGDLALGRRHVHAGGFGHLVVHGSELLGEVALDPGEDDEGDDQEEETRHD